MIGGSGAPEQADAVAALARQVERLDRALQAADIAGLRADVRDLAVAVAGVGEQVADLADTRSQQRLRSWLAPAYPDQPDQPAPGRDELHGLLDRLAGWVGQVYGWFGEGRLPDCWLWHPDVVEELLWLWQAWQAAYHGPEASIGRAADWHDRHRPGVARRIRAAAGDCSLREHLTPRPPPAVPAADAAAAIAGWWSAGPSTPAPTPTAEQITAADATHTSTVWSGQHP